MKLICNFDKFCKNMDDLGRLFKGVVQPTSMKSVIVRVSNTKFVSLYGLTSLAVYRADLLDCKVEVSESELNERGEYLFSIPFSKIDKMLDTYRNTGVSCTSDIIVEDDRRSLKITVREQEKDTYNVTKSTWFYMSGGLLPDIYEKLGVDVKRFAVQELDTELLEGYLNKLLPVIADDGTSYSKLYFSHDIIQVVNPHFISTMKNYLPTSFVGITLPYRVTFVLKNLLCRFNNVKCDRFDDYLYFVGDNFELCVSYIQGVKVRHDLQCNEDSSYLTIGGRYIENAVKRLKQADAQGVVKLTVDFDNGKIILSNGVFTQELNALSTKGFGNLELKLSANAFDKSVLDKDNVVKFSFDMNKHIIGITGDNDEWTSIALF